MDLNNQALQSVFGDEEEVSQNDDALSSVFADEDIETKSDDVISSVFGDEEAVEEEKEATVDPRYQEFLRNREYEKIYLKNKESIDALVDKTEQNELRVKYANQYPNLFTEGKLTDLAQAKQEGLVYEETVDLQGKPLAEPIIKFATPAEIEQAKGFEQSQDQSFRSKAPSIEEQMKGMMTIPDRDIIGERYTYPKPPRMVQVDYETYLNSQAFKDKVKDNPIMQKYYETFGETGAEVLAGISSGAQYVRGGFADLYKLVHEAVDDATDGDATKTINMDSKTAAKAFTGDIGQILEVGEKGAMMSILSRSPKALELAKDIFEAEIKRKKKLIKNAAKIKKYESRRLNINRAKSAEAEIIAKKAKDAADKASENQSIKEELIMDYEVQIGARDPNNVSKIIDEKKIISKTVAGKLSLDYDKARVVGLDIAKKEYRDVDAIRVDNEREVFFPEDLEQTMGIKESQLLSPIINPDKLDPLVAIASELKKNNPKLFPEGRMTIDNILNATVKGDLLPSDELTNLLNKYDVSFEEYILMTLGSASQAGKNLQKFAKIKGRKMGKRSRKEAIDQANLEKYNFAGKATIRFIDMGRGALVSMIATMLRNVESTLIRGPLEGFSNVFNTALYNLTEKGLKKKTLTVLSPTNWRNSFKHQVYLMDNLDARDYVNYILDRPDFRDKYNVLFSNVSELVRMRRPEGVKLTPVQQKVDELLEAGEDFVDTLNIPNKWQDYITRSAYFLQNLEDLFRKNYNGLDLVDELNKGRINEILKDSPTILPEGSKEFSEIIAEATEKARNATYSNVPNFPPFKIINEILAKYGGTAIVAFPRFVFTSLELIAQYSAGAALVPIRRLIRPNRFQKLTDRDREDISRNLVGYGVYLAASAYRKPESERPAWMQGYFDDPHPDYKMIRTAEGESFDTTPQYPLRQALYIAEFIDRWKEGTLKGSLVGDSKEFTETFLGATLRTGRGNSMIEDFVNALGGADASWQDRIAKTTGTAFGNFVQRYAVPAAQIIDLERSMSKLPEIRIGKDGKLIDYGLIESRPSQIKDPNIDPKYGDFGSTFMQSAKMPFIRRGFISPEEERKLPNRTYVQDIDGKNRIKPGLKIGAGATYYEDNPPSGLFMQKYGFTEFEMSSRASTPSIRRIENDLMNELIPPLAKLAQAREKQLIEQNKSKQFIQAEIRGIISSNLAPIKSMFKEAAYMKILEVGKDIPEEKRARLKNKFLLEQYRVKFKRLPKNVREWGLRIFEQEKGQPVDPNNGSDYVTAYTISKAYQSLFKMF